ncbi:MAG: type-F conjugative transfer system secretin TraK [Rickettsiaceae bacterium]|nr:type-F conjugative transfer system secretin TraK [Rickettsiaceae bacterium]
MIMKNEQISLGNFVVLTVLLNVVCFIMSDANASKTALMRKQELALDYKNPLTVHLSCNAINHINFKNNRILKIIGDQSKFSSIISSDGSHLFLTSKVAAGSEFDMSVVDVHSEVFDLHVIVQDVGKQVILTLEKLDLKREKSDLKVEEAKEMINAMQQGIKGKYYVTMTDREISFESEPNLEIRQYANYRYGKLWGACFDVRNKLSQNAIILNTNKVAGLFKNVIGAFPVQVTIFPLKNSKIFIVFEGESL